MAGVPLEHFETLRHSGLPRQPREYFEGPDQPEVIDRLAPLRPPEPDSETPETWWWRVLAAGSTENAVWGGKIMWGHTDDFVARALLLVAENSLDAALRSLLGEVQLVFVTRPDTVSQAVSLWKAVQTEEWRDGHGSGNQAEYSFAAIDHLVRQLRDQDEAWRNWFAESGRRPHTVTYDELDDDPRGAAASVLSLLGLTADVPEPPLERQSDERSERWADRYRADAGVVG